jgi:serine/threonine protein phosphatase PrpC
VHARAAVDAHFTAAHFSSGGDDRCAVHHAGDHLVVVVADGAGNSRQGRHAAQTVVDIVGNGVACSVLNPVTLLRACDRVLAAGGRDGQTTAVIAIVDAHGVRGASVGDSGAWIVTGAGYTDLTVRQIPKPLLGSGQANPVTFEHGPLRPGGDLVVATDGLLKYIRPRALSALLEAAAFDELPRRLVGAVRLRSGALADDATVVLVRPTLPVTPPA